MSIITELKVTCGGSKATLIFDDLSSFDIGKEALQESGIHIGLDMSSQQIQELKQRDLYFSCLHAASHFLAHRPRSKREVDMRLQQRGFSRETIDTVLNKLEEKKLLDDAEFARAWTENRMSFSPRSKLLVRQELKLKGISDDLLNETIADLDDDENAYQAGLKKRHLFKLLPREEFTTKLSRYLQTKGFGYSVTKNAIDRLWQEIQNAENNE